MLSSPKAFLGRHTGSQGRETVDPKTGLVVIRYELTPEQRKQRREDNRAAKKLRQFHRRKKHGRQ